MPSPKFLLQFRMRKKHLPGNVSLHDLDHIRDIKLWSAVYKKMDMIRHSLHCQDLEFIFFYKVIDENFKIEGRELGSALVLEFLLYYLTKPECQLKVREEIYLDNMLDLF